MWFERTLTEMILFGHKKYKYNNPVVGDLYFYHVDVLTEVIG
jgi:hypothetical protein